MMVGKTPMENTKPSQNYPTICRIPIDESFSFTLIQRKLNPKIDPQNGKSDKCLYIYCTSSSQRKALITVVCVFILSIRLQFVSAMASSAKDACYKLVSLLDLKIKEKFIDLRININIFTWW